MSSSVLSAAQGGDAPKPYRYQGYTAPKGLSTYNSSSSANRTAWTNETNPYGTPAPLNSNTAGSFYKFNDSPTSTKFEEK
jgi:hypothetical protein